MTTSIVTGGAGFIGAHLTNELLKQGHKVVVLDDLSGGFKENVNQKADFIEGSILDIKLLEELFKKYEFDYVFHLAAYAAEGLSHFIRNFNYTNNLIGSVNVINESVKNNIKCFVFTSSIAVYGTGTLPLKEDSIPEPEDPYGVAKLAVEQDLKAAHDMFGLNYVIFRPHNVYGEFQNIGDKYRNVIGIFMNQIMKKKALTVFGDGKQTRAFSYIGDVAPYIAESVRIKNAYNQVYNIGGDKIYSVNELADEVVKISKSENDIIHLEPRNEVVNAYSDHSKLYSVFKRKAATDLHVGLTKMWSWVKTIGIKKSRKFENIEIEKNIPASWLED